MDRSDSEESDLHRNFEENGKFDVEEYRRKKLYQLLDEDSGW